MEKLDRGVIAVRSGNSNYIGWRLLGTDPADIGFNVYRGSVKLNSTPITNSTNYLDTGGTLSSTYRIAPVINGIERKATDPVSVWSTPYLTIPLQVPAGVTTPDGYTCTYSPNDCSVGDLDGDGQYEIIVKWDPDNSKDNAQSGYTGNVYLDAYKLDGTFLWRIDLGINIRAGAHYTQFLVYDFDSDGRAEVVCRTAPFTRDGQGNYVLMPGDTLTDYRNSSGYIITGPEYLTVFDGLTGAALATTRFLPDRGSASQWGDNYGNRCDRFLAGVAYLDGQRPSIIMARGYYGPQSGYSARNEITAWDWRSGQLTLRWWFKAHTSGPNSNYIGQGCHSLSIADVDGDGFDEIIYGACAIDHDGKPLYSTGLGHGDALHVSDMDPDRPGLEVWQCHESSPYGATFRDAGTGEVIFRYTASGDTGRACAGDIRADYRGYEVWASTGVPLSTCTGISLGSHSNPINFMVWWDGDLLREFLNSNVISKYGVGTLLTATGCSANNGTKSTPCLSADLFGDWREEVIWRTNDNTALRIYTTTAVTNHRLYTLMHDSQYRVAIAWQNVGYNQPPHPSFYLGDGMAPPPVPNIILAGDNWVYGDFTDDGVVNLDDLPSFADIWLLNDCGLTTGLDLNEDCLINYYEFAVFAENWEGPERVPPAVPTGLLAWAGDGMVTLDWADNTESDLLGYNVYRSETSGSGYILLNPNPLTASAYVDTSVQNGLTYYYVVTAVDKRANESAYSSEVLAAPNSITTIVIQENEPGFIGVFTGTIDSNNAGFTGTGFANTTNAVGMYIEWSVYAASAGTVQLQWRYANGSSNNRTAAVSVGGVTQAANISFPSTGSWTSWTTSALVPVSLSAGNNRIRLIAEMSEGLANIDWMSVTGVSPLPGS
ncbi:MAG: carbohydrate-binding domain-containing protein [Anaerohalosphaeraceae bacterium]